MKLKNLMKPLLPVLLLLTLGSSVTEAQTRINAQTGIKPLLFRNGQTVDIGKSYTLEELKKGIVLNPVEGLEIAAIYLVRESRPVKALKVKDKADLDQFDLYAWGMGKDASGKSISPSSTQFTIEPGDRFAFDATYQGEQASFTVLVK